jgi:histidine kinase
MQADESKLKQVLFNLLSNAIKFTPAGGKVLLEGSSNEHEVIVSILDTGIGIAPEEQPRIFGKFYQVYSAEGKSASGPGLGLTLAKSYIELHGGRIWVESEGLGKGSRFTFTLPLKNSHETEKNES